MKIGIVGASGNVGQRLITEALKRGHAVTATSRNVASIAARDGLRTVSADFSDLNAGIAALSGQDVAIVSLRYDSIDFEHLLTILKRSGVKRALFVGGAASLEVAPGKVLIDTPEFPEFIKPEAEPARQALNRLRQEKDLDWTFLSPSVFFEAGERTGKFRLGKDQLLTAEDGRSHISYEDFSIAMLDEVETPKHRRERFTIGY